MTRGTAGQYEMEIVPSSWRGAFRLLWACRQHQRCGARISRSDGGAWGFLCLAHRAGFILLPAKRPPPGSIQGMIEQAQRAHTERGGQL